ncbi:prohibitin family protein [Candidatus Dojkabacteria bacterium]|nr:prohibitin family protein [Candidatus Dojkabacteria bacterium]
MKKYSKLFVLLPVLITIFIIFIILLPSIFVVIDAGEIGVQKTFGKVSDSVFQPGFHIKNPFTRIVRMSTRTQQYSMISSESAGGDDSIQALASDGASVWLDVTVFYHLQDIEAPEVYKKLGLDYDEKIIRPEIRSKIRGVMSDYTVIEIYSTKREEVQNKILEELETTLEDRGIIAENLLLRKVTLSNTLFNSIEEKLTAQQKAQRKEFEIEEARREAERKQIEAEGQREAQRIINESLTDRYLYYLYIQALETNPNTVYVPTEGGVALFKNIE